MHMSMDKPIALNRAGGTRGPQVENAKMWSKKTPLEHGSQNMYMSMDKPMTLNRAEGTRAKMMSTIAQLFEPKYATLKKSCF